MYTYININSFFSDSYFDFVTPDDNDFFKLKHIVIKKEFLLSTLSIFQYIQL